MNAPPFRPGHRAGRLLRRVALGLLGALGAAQAAPRSAQPPACLSDCTPRIGIVAAFGAEADLLRAQLQQPRTWTLHGHAVHTGVLGGHRVALTLSGVSIVNATLSTQLLLDHFRIERLLMSGIAGGLSPEGQVGDVVVPDRWALPLELYWAPDTQLPAPCGPPGELGCLGLQSARPDGQPVPPWVVTAPGAPAAGLYLRSTQVLNAANAPAGEFRFDHPVDAAMLATARQLQPALQRCGPRARRADGGTDPALCVQQQPRLQVGGRGLSAPVFLANAAYRRYLREALQGQVFDMETAALAQVAAVNQVPYLAFRSLSDLAGAEGFNADVGALFSSGLAEANEAAVTLAFLQAWRDPRTLARAVPLKRPPPRR